jgi:hypothetical protein
MLKSFSISLFLTLTIFIGIQLQKEPITESTQKDQHVSFVYEIYKANHFTKEYYGESSEGVTIYLNSSITEPLNVSDNVRVYFDPGNAVDGIIKVERLDPLKLFQ